MTSWLWPYLLVGAGGFLGANARFILARGIGTMIDTRFPLGTLVVNISGSFLMGILGAVLADRVLPDAPGVRMALAIGFLGGFTTFSTFEFETHALLEEGSWLLATANVLVSVLVGLLAVRAGIVAARSWPG
ncbi:MAG: fluoride efflux transporter CrcB [Acidobacteria bacterium]|nr:fluoride efflux transporter CrcB [Acidobacteriota bacterium]